MLNQGLAETTCRRGEDHNGHWSDKDIGGKPTIQHDMTFSPGNR